MKQHSDLIIFVIQRILVLIYCLAFLIHPILHSDFESSFVPVCRITLSGRSCGATIEEWYMLSVLAPCFFFYFDYILLWLNLFTGQFPLADAFQQQIAFHNVNFLGQFRLLLRCLEWATLFRNLQIFIFFSVNPFSKIQFYILFYRSIFIWIFWVYFFFLRYYRSITVVCWNIFALIYSVVIKVHVILR